MNFRDQELKLSYRSEADNIIDDFYKKVLGVTSVYKRAVGYFSTGSLLLLGPILDEFIKNNSKMYLIASPDLQPEDIELIRSGYELRETLVHKRIIEAIVIPETDEEKKQLSKIEKMIANGNLDIKIAFRDHQGIFHEKIGIVTDKEKNRIAFNGSLNETGNAYNYNFESIDLYFSWDSRDLIRIETKEKDFDLLWENKTKNLTVIDFTQAIRNKLFEYKESGDLPIIEETEPPYLVELNEPTVPYWLEKGIRPYQLSAYNSWISNNYRGIFEMATGTGKTITACYSLVKHYQECKLQDKKQIVIVVVPYTHLVEQWENEMLKFGYKPYKAYSDITNWTETIQAQIMRLNFDKNRKHLSIITTINSFKTPKFKTLLHRMHSNFEVVFLGDEAHNLGADNISKELPQNIKNRLGLTATPIRHNDEQGTQKLLEYFDDIIFSYSLKDAIENGYLTKYYYYPIVTYLDAEDSKQFYDLLDQFKGYSINKLKQLSYQDNNFKEVVRLTYQIADGSLNKLSKFKEIISKHKDSYYNLVYCNSVLINDGMKKVPIKQIDAINTFLGIELSMRIHRFTAVEDIETRKVLLNRFANGNDIQALVAMKCLDEGVDVPATKRAFIMSSTTNEKQFIQRRGRVLRNSPGKDFAEIYDFVTLPRAIEEVRRDGVISDAELYIISKEYKRIIEFASLAVNSSEGLSLAYDLNDTYNFDKIEF